MTFASSAFANSGFQVDADGRFVPTPGDDAVLHGLHRSVPERKRHVVQVLPDNTRLIATVLEAEWLAELQRIRRNRSIAALLLASA